MHGQERLPQTIGGYRIVRRLAREASVDVLLARTEARGQEHNVVLKLVSPPFRGDAGFDALFARETQAIAQLDHPCIVRLYDVFSAPDIKAMVLEHVDGPSLGELRANLVSRGESLPDAAVYGVASALFSALAVAHAARDPQNGNLLPIVHRDVNPSQILVGRDGSVKLAGFGLERITGVRGDARNAEARGYLPPEKARGEAVTTRSDVYATMLVIWELLARRRAIRDDALPEQELARALAQPTIVSLEVLRPEVPALVRSIVARGLEPQVDRRAVTAEEAASIFRSAVNAEEARGLIAQAVARMDAPRSGPSPEPPRAREPSLPSFPLGGSEPPPPGLTPSPGAVNAERRGPPRPSPRRMWGSSPTLTPSGGFQSPPSSRGGSIPDARFSQELDRASAPPPRPAAGATPPPPPPASSQRPPTPGPGAVAPRPPSSKPPPVPPSRPPPPSSATQSGGFDARHLAPLIATPPPEPVREPAASLPGMQVPLMAPATPPPPTVAGQIPSPLPPPPGAPASLLATADGGPFWSQPPAAGAVSGQTAPTVRPPRVAKKGGSMTTLAIGLFLVAAAVGAGGFVWLFRKPVAPVTQVQQQQRTTSVLAPQATSTATATATATASASATATATASATPSATPTPSATASATASAVPSAAVSVAALPTVTAKPTAATPGVDASSGLVRVDKKAAGHRVFIDGKVVGEGEGPFTVACGKHTVKVGSRGKPQAVNVPCGGEVAVSK